MTSREDVPWKLRCPLFFPFSESSDWEAKFYQIQSKYLLLLNELHNPQVRRDYF